jgi:hypothetical protein
MVEFSIATRRMEEARRTFGLFHREVVQVVGIACGHFYICNNGDDARCWITA